LSPIVINAIALTLLKTGKKSRANRITAGIPISKRKSASIFITKDNFRQHKRSALVLPDSAQGIEVEIPQDCRRRDEDLERKARFFAALPQKMRPKSKKCL
jgi:hypothetical protein